MKSNSFIDKYNDILESILVEYIFVEDINDILYRAKRKYEELEKLLEDKEDKKSKKEQMKLDIQKEITIYSKNENLINALVDFCEMRESIGKKIKTKGTLTRLFNRLDSLSNDNDSVKIQLLDKAILNNWQSVWAEDYNSSFNKANIKNSQTASYVKTPTLQGQELEKFILGKNDLDEF